MALILHADTMPRRGYFELWHSVGFFLGVDLAGRGAAWVFFGKPWVFFSHGAHVACIPTVIAL